MNAFKHCSMSSFFSDDDQDDQEQGRGQIQRQEPAGSRRGRSAPRLARHLRPTTATTSDTASVPALGQEDEIPFRSDAGYAGNSRRVALGGLDLGLDEDELFGGAGDVPAEAQGQLLADIGIGGAQDEDEEEETDVKRLTKVWVRERGTPEIMQWEGELVEECLHRLQQQVSPRRERRDQARDMSQADVIAAGRELDWGNSGDRLFGTLRP
ncbi:hypothetical protein QFC22_001518 [Naganishia vaughanmartiniae]|uniref:Uncharacterized protein n=1 Tax=Naganishia vaughanmartiniae TaxID=1424756 RepID=A0ACC2XIS6_9TREE|nr:hypothetical protein QFC22_001518 [Naganishia vaughanmartiniae]